MFAASLSLDPVWPWPALAVLAAALAAAGVVGYRRTTRPISSRRRRLLVSLRLTAVAVCVLALLRPACVYREIREEQATLAILLDRSQSMTIQDAWKSLSRAKAAAQTYRDCAPALRRLKKTFTIKEYGFGKQLARLDDIDLPPPGVATALGDALEEVLRKNRGRRLGAVVVLGDGANNKGAPPQAMAARYGRQNIPIYTVAFGREVIGPGMQDIVARDIRTNRTVFAKNRMAVTGEFVARGFRGAALSIELVFDGKVVDRQLARPISDDDIVRVDLEHIPPTPGDFKVAVRCPVQEGELLETNNASSTFVTVLEGGLQVMQIEGTARWEAKYVRLALGLSEDIQIESITALGGLGGGRDRVLAEADLAEEKIRATDVFILGDVARDRFTTTQLRQMAKAVEEGAGLLAIGGWQSFGAGGWDQGPLAEAMPVVMGPADGQLKGAVRMLPTEAGERHFVMRLASANREAWQKLDPLAGASQLGRPKALARVLALAKDGAPLLVAHDYGQGRVMAFAGDTTYQWYMGSPETRVLHKKFWRQVILWLAHRDQTGRKRVWVRVDQVRVPVGGKVEITAQVEDGTGAAVREATVQAELLRPGGAREPVTLSRRGDQFRGTLWQTDVVGDYTVEVTGGAGGEPVGADQARFEVYAESLELANPKADASLLAAVAEASGGKPWRPEQLGDQLLSLEKLGLAHQYEQVKLVTLWDNALVLMVFVGLIAVEWVLRKRQGLV